MRPALKIIARLGLAVSVSLFVVSRGRHIDVCCRTLAFSSEDSGLIFSVGDQRRYSIDVRALNADRYQLTNRLYDDEFSGVALQGRGFGWCFFARGTSQPVFWLFGLRHWPLIITMCTANLWLWYTDRKQRADLRKSTAAN